MKKSTLLQKVNQTGSMMIEALAMLTLISLVTPTLYKKSAERTTELQDINTATHVRTLIKAVDNYTAANYQSVLSSLNPGESGVLDYEELSEYLPYGYSFDAIKSFDTPIVTVKRQADSDSLTSFVFFPQKGDINDLRASRIASMIGANGGVVDKDGNAKGVGGIWSLTDAEVEEQLNKCEGSSCTVTKGSIVAASAESINEASRAAFENPKYLQRTYEGEGEEWRNTMVTDLYMGGTKNILEGGAIIPYSKILGVDQMIIGDTEAEAGVQADADLIVKAHGSSEGAAFIEGSLRALNGKLRVTENEDVTELDFDDGLLHADTKEFSVNVNKDNTNPDFIIAKNEGAERAMATLNVSTLVTEGNDFETESDTYLASKEGGRLFVGPTGRILTAKDDSVDILNGKVQVTKSEDSNGDPVSDTYVSTTTVQIDGKTTVGTRVLTPGNEEPMVPNLNPQLTVKGNAYVSDILEAGEIDTKHFDALRLSAGGRGWDEENRNKRWLNVDADGILVKDLEEVRKTRMVIDADETTLYGPDKVDGQGSMYIGATNAGLYGIEQTEIYTSSSDGNVNIQSGAITATRTAGNDNHIDMRTSRLQVAGSDDANVAFEIIPGEGLANHRSISAVTSDVDRFLVKKGDDMKLLSIASNENGATLNKDATVEIDPTVFRVRASGQDASDVNNQILEVNAGTGQANNNGAVQSEASVYIRRGAIEVEGAPNVEGTNKADEGIGYVEASRFVANNLDANGVPIKPHETTASGYDKGDLYDRYMVNPAYTSVMHDIKLTTRGGARLSDILPDFINKGIYIVNNTYKDGVNFNNLNVSLSDRKINVSGAEEVDRDKIFVNHQNEWASPYMGIVPAPQCPPGHARVITLTPVSFQMAQSGDMVLSQDGRYYIRESDRVNDLADVTGISTGGEVTGARLQQPYEIVKNATTGEKGYIYYLGLDGPTNLRKNGEYYAPKPLYFQQSTWLKSKVIAYGSGGKCSGQTGQGCGNNFLGWAAVMGFIYPYDLYKPIIDSLRGSDTGRDDIASNTVYWNVFPVQAYSMEAYATVYCYFDRTNIFNSGNDPAYVDQYDQLNRFRSTYTKKDNNNEAYTKRLNDPHLKYKDPW